MAKENVIINDWDKHYYENQLLRIKYNVDSNNVKEYFELKRVIKGFYEITGRLFGINTYMSNTISTGGTSSTTSGAIFHKSAAVCAVQQDVRVQAEYSIDALGTKVVAALLYGTALIDSASNKRGYRWVYNYNFVFLICPTKVRKKV